MVFFPPASLNVYIPAEDDVMFVVIPPREILKHKELDGQINTDLLGPLLQQDHRDRLEEQFLTNRQVKPEFLRHVDHGEHV